MVSYIYNSFFSEKKVFESIDEEKEEEPLKEEALKEEEKEEVKVFENKEDVIISFLIKIAMDDPKCVALKELGKIITPELINTHYEELIKLTDLTQSQKAGKKLTKILIEYLFKKEQYSCIENIISKHDNIQYFKFLLYLIRHLKKQDEISIFDIVLNIVKKYNTEYFKILTLYKNHDDRTDKILDQLLLDDTIYINQPLLDKLIYDQEHPGVLDYVKSKIDSSTDIGNKNMLIYNLKFFI